MAASKQGFFVKGHSCSLDTSIPPNFCIKLKQESIPVHKEVLLSVSDYFCCLFESGMKEVQNQTLNLEDLDVNSEVVMSVVAYMYGEDIIIEWKDIRDFMDIVECWQIFELKDKLEDYVGSNINTDDCITWSVLAQRYQMKKVQARTNDFITSNFATVSASSEFLSLDASALKDLLTINIIMNTSCNDKLQACINWILVKEADRKNYFEDLLEHTRLIRCSHGFIQLVVRSYMSTVSDEDSRSVKPYTSLLPILAFWIDVPARDKRQTMIVLGDKTKKHLQNKNILQCDFDKATINVIGSLPDAFVGSFPARCSTPYGMFSGGGGSHKYEGSVTCALLDIPSMAYLRLPDLPVPVSDASALCVRDKVYIFGGCQTETLVLCLDLRTLQWCQCANMPLPSAHPTVCSTDATIYALVKAQYRICVLTYSTEEDVWSTAEPGVFIDSSYDAITCAVPDGVNLYVVTTGAKKRACICYDTKSKQWTNQKDFDAIFDLCTGVCINKKIVLCGSFQPRIDVCDTVRSEWEENPLTLPGKTLNMFTMAL